MNQPPPATAVNGAPPAARPLPRKKPAGADGLFKPTNNQKKRYPLGAPPKALVRPPSGRGANLQPDLNAINAFSNARTENTKPTQNSLPQNVPVREFKLVTSKRELLDGLRYHLLQVDDKLPLDIRNENDFTKPARLHRRNPDWKTQVKEGDEPKEADAETEALNKRRDARQKEREANLAQIAPSANSNRRKLFTKKTAQVYHNDYTEEEKRRIQMNYEEKLPWVLEDFDNRHILIGKHNQGSMGVYAAFAHEASADGASSRFRLLPIEKSYRFEKPSNVQANVDFNDVFNAWSKKKNVEPEFLMRKREARRQEIEREREAKINSKLFLADQSLAMTREGEDADLDFEDDFADDEEGDMFGDKDEDEKAAEKKVKEDHLKANIGWQEKDEREVEASEHKEDESERLKGIWSGAMRSKLEKRERNYNLGSDSDDNSSSDSEEERQRLEAEKQANLKKEEEGGKSALSSGANTPSGRKEKHPASDREGAMKKSSSSKSLKRPGSPNLSDASGTDASTVRKKKKKSHHSSSQGPTSGGSRPMSPDGLRPRGAGSDTDGGAMSDGTRIKIKVKKPGSPSSPNSPPTSRAGSPAPGARRNLETGPLPTTEEIRARIPPEGMVAKDFIGLYKTPTDPERKAQWTAFIRKLILTKNGRVYLKDAAPPPVPPGEAAIKSENANPAG
ncbi:uncharacterized protein HMPREF1541_02422 [Cyphellophora europaea CBS 101466]|uniref:Uncharacterized protein n=1 Tax=Cyphellophora europaea (strain CBS 101466) TaxID=1220924 RepID=W2S5D4_CYPE1|nr:uncharacterized protein HMPREF1541_02422 [Cyphellophora europaea CBS 101466]ETN43263.1 hypothetical protein HMPREF1541_02422 [Cyphellophora europaea CBS 101466]